MPTIVITIAAAMISCSPVMWPPSPDRPQPLQYDWPMSPHRLIAEYERWLDERIATIAEGRRQKHRRLRESPFAFLRGAYPVWLARNADMAYGPMLLAIGDLHV